MRVEYRSNNSGGHWWLADEDWLALEKAGWNVHWVKDESDHPMMKPGEERWLGALATTAEYVIDAGGPDTPVTLRGVIRWWEELTGQSARELGCYSCCGPPHAFSMYDDNDKGVEYYSPEAPLYGSEY